jgi:hypothetical protein
MMEKTRDTRTIGVAIIRLNGITIISQCRIAAPTPESDVNFPFVIQND